MRRDKSGCRRAGRCAQGAVALLGGTQVLLQPEPPALDAHVWVSVTPKYKDTTFGDSSVAS